MKRTKTGLQPTRVMPRRGKTRGSGTDAGENSQSSLPHREDKCHKTRKRIVAENSSVSESQPEPEVSASINAHGSPNGHQKRRKLDAESSTRSKSSPANKAVALTDGHGNRKSPDLSCSICLSAVENRAFTDACYHTFCFECLVEWSRVRAVCPLCKKSFHSIIHSFRSYDDYKLYHVPKSYMSNSINMPSPNNSTSSHFARVGRLMSGANAAAMPPLNDGDPMLALRRRLYSHSDEMQLRGLLSSDGVVISPPHQVSPAMFDCYPVMLERVRPWVLRDIAVIIDNGEVSAIADIVLGLLRNFPITSEDFYERLFPYLGLHTRRFLHELDAFARSPFDMTTYDARAVYSTGANLETFLPFPTEHVEDISSSDDSDIEIVSPAVVSSESAYDSSIGLMTDHMLGCLRTFQHSLFMSFMSRASNYHSGLESPIPGPSGLGQAVLTDENGSVGSRASQSAYDGEERSDSPMVLSDADSDIVVVDVDRSVRSPIHISSGEDDNAEQHIRAHRRARKRRRRTRDHRDRRSEFEQNDGVSETAVKNEVPRTDVTSPPTEADTAGHGSTDCFVEHNVDLLHAVEQSENITQIQQRSSSQNSSIKLSDHTPASALVSPSKPYLQHDGKPADMEKPRFQHSHLKRSRSANSVTNLSVTSSADDTNPLPCKKHVRGHKSSKQKAREVVTEKSSADVVCDNAEKLITGDKTGSTAAIHDLPDTESNEKISTDVLNEVAVPSVGESSIAYAGFSSHHSPVSSLLEELMDEQQLATVSQSDHEIPVPCTSEVCSLPAALSSGSVLEDTRCSSVPTAEVSCVAANECLPIADENSRQSGDCAGSSSFNVVRVHSLASDENADGGNIDNCDPETDSVLSLDFVQSSSVDAADGATAPVHPADVWSSCADTLATQCQLPFPELPSLTDSCLTFEHNNCISETSCSLPASSSTSSNSNIEIHSVSTCRWENQDFDIGLQTDFNDSLPLGPQECESVLFSNSSSREDAYFNDASCLCTDTASSNNPSSLPTGDIRSTASEMTSATSQLMDCSLMDQFPSATSPGLIIDASQPSPADLDPATNDSIAIASPVGIDSSDSEVECLETDVFGRQRCISISSGDSSILCSPSDTDDVESVLSDSDSLEIFDDEPQTLQPEDLTTRSIPSSKTHPASPQNSALLPSSSDVASSGDVDERDPAVFSEQVTLKQTLHPHAVPATEYSGDITLQSKPVASGSNQDSITDADGNNAHADTVNEYSGDIILESNPAASGCNQDSVTDADANICDSNTAGEYSGDITVQSNPADSGNIQDCITDADDIYDTDATDEYSGDIMMESSPVTSGNNQDCFTDADADNSDNITAVECSADIMLQSNAVSSGSNQDSVADANANISDVDELVSHH